MQTARPELMPVAQAAWRRRTSAAFWFLVCVDVLALLVLFVMSMGESNHDGGRDMAVFFFIMVPAFVIGLGVLLKRLTRAPFWHVVALAIVAAPGLLLALQWLT